MIQYLETLVSRDADHVVNHHIYEIAAKQAASNPESVLGLIKQAVAQELKSLDAGGKDLWHPKNFTKTLNVIEQIGPEYKTRVHEIRESLQPYKEQRRIFDLYEFGLVD